MTIFPGLDASGNSNNWTENNINNTGSTATTYDIMTDVPTLTDADTANYAVMNPLVPNGTMTNGNLQVASRAANGYASLASISVSETGNWYCEVTPTSKSAGDYHLGIFGYTTVHTPYNPRLLYVGAGSAYNDGTNVGTWASYTTNDIIGIAYNSSTKTAYFYKNNSLQGSMTTTATENMYFGTVGDSSGTSQNYAFNFGQRPLAYTPPTGYLKLNTFNLPDSSIVDGSENFNTVLYTGNGGTQSIASLDFGPDLTWIKVTNSASYEQMWFDSVRGATKYVRSNNDAAEGTVANSLTSFDSNGFSLGANGDVNGSTFPIVAWNWKAGGTAVLNEAGTIDSQVSANTTAGFSIATFTGNGLAAQTIGHGLSQPTEIYMWKRRDSASNWGVQYTIGDGSVDLMLLNLTNAKLDVGAYFPTATTEYISGGGAGLNVNGGTYVAYSFHSVEGYSKMGSYTGNGSADGPFVYTGFKPAYIMFKTTTIISHWTIVDNARSTYNVVDDSLYADTSAAELTTITDVDFLSNGFKWRGVLANETNVSGQVYIYMAFAENPFKNSLAR